MKLLLPEQVKQIIQTLESRGQEAYAVGGCVRDTALGKEPSDWDITTSATPEQIKEIFSRTVDTGIQHGTVTVLLGGGSYEVTTYRIDGVYKDGRHPEQVSFCTNLEEDLKRRDFTINAMAYNDTVGLVDLFGGMEDLQAGMIRCVGVAEERFSEDALRMLRALRFGAQLGFALEADTYQAICRLAPTIEKVSMERIQVELVKLITSPNPAMIEQVYRTGLSKVFFPELDVMMETPQNNKHHCYSVGMHTIHAMEGVPAERLLRLTMLFHDIAKPATKTTDEEGQDHFYNHQQVGAEMSREILRRLKFDNDTIAYVKHMVRYHDERPTIERRPIRRAIARVGKEYLEDLFLIKRADTLAQSLYRRQEKLDDIDAFEAMSKDILAAGECVEKKTMAIDGRDLLALGVPQGKEVGAILDRLYAMVIDAPECNNHDTLLQYARQMMEEVFAKSHPATDKKIE